MKTKGEQQAIIGCYVHYSPDSLLKYYKINDQRHLLIERLQSTPIEKAVFLLHHFLQSAPFVGDVCEFGVAQGCTSALLAYELMQLNSSKHLHLYDSFEGLPMPTKEDVLLSDIFKLGSMEAYAGTMSCPDTDVIKELEFIGFPTEQYHIVRGFVTNETPVPDKISFAYVDFDLYAPIILILNKIHEHMSLHGVIVIDDYGAFSAGAQKAVDEFFAQHKKEYLTHYRGWQMALTRLNHDNET